MEYITFPPINEYKRPISLTFATDKAYFYKFIQARKHNAKRINKKWEKKYGYKMIEAR